jgi:hypothetical protein
VGGHFAEDVSVALKVIAAENRTTVQKLLAEGINAVFAKYQKPQIADISTHPYTVPAQFNGIAGPR